MPATHGWIYVDDPSGTGTWSKIANSSCYGGYYMRTSTTGATANAFFNYVTRVGLIGLTSTTGRTQGNLSKAYWNGSTWVFDSSITISWRSSSTVLGVYLGGFTWNGAKNVWLQAYRDLGSGTGTYAYTDYAQGYVPTLECVTDYPNGHTVSGIFTASGWVLDVSGVQYMDVYIDGVNRGRATINQTRTDVLSAYPEHGISNAGWSFSYNSTNLSNGTHTIYFNICDGTGNIHSNLAQRTFYVNNLAFLHTVDNPTQNLQCNGTINLSGWALDQAGINRVEAYCDSAYLGNCTTGIQREDIYNSYPSYGNHYSGYSKSLNTDSYSIGNHTVLLRAVNNSGTTYDISRTINVINSNPIIASVTVTPNPITSGNTVINFSVTDINSDKVNYTLTCNSFTSSQSDVTGGSFSASIPISYLNSGSNNFSITASDARGGNATSYNGTITFNSVAPVIGNPSITPTTTTNTAIVITATITDSNLEDIVHRVSVTNDGTNYTFIYPTDGTWAVGGTVNTSIPVSKLGILQSGVNTIRIEGKDVRGNISSYTSDVTFNSVNPAFTLTSITPTTRDVNGNVVTVNESVVIIGTVSDSNNDDIYYRVKANSTVVPGYDWASSPVASNSSISITIPLSALLSTEVNTVSIDLKDSHDVQIDNAWTFENKGIVVANLSPSLAGLQVFDEFGLERYTTINNRMIIRGSITDLEYDTVDYYIYNTTYGKLIRNYQGLQSSPTSVETEISLLDLLYGTNQIKIDVKDGSSRTGSRTIAITKKKYDSTYIENSINYKDSALLKVNINAKTYFKIPDIVRSAGYLKTAEFSIYVNSVVGGGQVKMALITNNWSALTINISEPLTIPIYDTTFVKDVTLIEGQNYIDIMDLMQHSYDNLTQTYGFVFYSELENTDVSISANDLSYTYTYYDTKILQPNKVHYNYVDLSWMPIKSVYKNQFTMTSIIRSKTSDFSSYDYIYYTTDINTTSFRDMSVQVSDTKYYYKIIVEYGIQHVYVSDYFIEIPIPSTGYRRYWNEANGSYDSEVPTEGIGFDTVSLEHTGDIRFEDHDFYTRTDGIILKPLDFGDLVGCHESNVMGVVVENLSDVEDFIVSLEIIQNGVGAYDGGDYAILPDTLLRTEGTKVKMSLTEDPFVEQYPIQFELDHIQSKIVYIKILPILATRSDSLFQINLIATRKL